MTINDQAQFMRMYNESHREEFEPELFRRDNKDMVDSIERVVCSCERDKYFTLKLISFEAIYDYEEIYNTLRAHEEKRRKKNDKTTNSYDFINIRDTDMILVKLVWYIRHNGMERQEIDNKTIVVNNPEQNLEVLIALPRFVKGYYFRLSGNYYSTSFQIVDGSTYNNSTASQSKVDTVTMKTMFGPIIIFRSFKNIQDMNSGEVLKVIEYNSIIFKTVVNAMTLIIANYGLYGGAQFLGIDCVRISREPVIRDDYVSFCNNNIYISCPKVCFQDVMVQSLVATIYDAIGKDTNINDLFNTRYWLLNLGKSFKNASIDKGLFVLDSVDGIYDNTTKFDLHLPMEDKENIYCIIRWLLREFPQLRVKENVDVRTKRIRISDYIAQVYALKLNKGLHRMSDLGSRVTLSKIIQGIYTNPMYVLSNISTMSNLVAYRDMVNDNDATVALKYTYKGISGLGEDGTSVQPVYRYVDPSHIGILDLDASSGSDPGMSGMICPMKKIYNHSFSEYAEPNSWRENFAPLEAQYKEGTITPIEFENAPDFQFDKLRDKIAQEELDISRAVCPLENIYDPNITYTTYASQQKQLNIEKPKEEKLVSLFTIRSNEE